MTDAQDLYTTTVRHLPLYQRLRLAALILEELTQPGGPGIDWSDAWSEDDVKDLTVFSLQQASAAYPEDQELV
jgi:hypothetical protein